MAVLHIWSPDDAMLGFVAPVALAMAAGTALVVDLDEEGPQYPGEVTLASLVRDGPRAADLQPTRKGVALLRNGGIAEANAAEAIDALTVGWPNLVLRLPAHPPPVRQSVVPVLPLTPLTLDRGPAVFQRGPWAAPERPNGVVLPRPRASTIRSLLAGRRPGPSRWLRAWREVWGIAWA